MIEGVSGASLLERLEALGVDYAQGFGVELPRPLEQMLVTAPSPTPRQRSRQGAASSRP
jgi:EAL domain-containing protein (putative c-di-GMP-specific phosphodiesterase class I)